MKNLSLKICLAIATLLASVGSGFALPKCPSSPKFVSTYKDILNWHNCVGTVTYGSTAKYTGEFKNNMRWGAGIFSYNKKQKNSPKVQEGIFQNNQFLYAQKTPYTRKPSVLRTAFIKLSKENRRQLQTNLKDLGFYKSSIDGLYGKGTASALAKYNKQNLNGADLKKSENVEKLFNVVLELKPSPKPKPKTKSDEKPKPKRDLEKEFGLSLYGTFLHSEKVPNALFFFDEINNMTVLNFGRRYGLTMLI